MRPADLLRRGAEVQERGQRRWDTTWGDVEREHSRQGWAAEKLLWLQHRQIKDHVR